MTRLQEYRMKLQDQSTGMYRAQFLERVIMLALAGASVVLIATIAYTIQRKVPGWCALLPVLLIVALGRQYLKNRSARQRAHRLTAFYERGVARLENRFAGHSGEEYRVHGHAYESDLGLFGPGSLFEFLCTARTEIGRRRLASYLLLLPDPREVRLRQEAVRELTARSRLREDTALLGKWDFRDAYEESFSASMHTAEIPSGTLPLRVLAFATSALLAFLVLYAYFVLPVVAQSWAAVAPLLAAGLAINLCIASAVRARSGKVLEALRGIGPEIGVLREGIALLQKQQFSSTKLRAIQAELIRDDATAALRRLDWLLITLDNCDKWAFELASRALIARTQLSFAIEQWRVLHGRSLKRWLEAWAEFEALAALGGYAYEHPADCFPEFSESAVLLNAKDLGHPMLPAETCVRNDISLHSGQRLYVISGSNMAGKSTLLRAIGVNMVLAYAGAPVRAASLILSSFSLCASLAVVDSLREGKSRFLAEIDKLRQMMESAESATPVLFLIDEILDGTNSRDRRIAGESIVRALIAKGALGALSTHDLALTEIADIPDIEGVNVHMGSRAGSDDPMDFDYLLKPGVTSETNALAIAKMAGVMPSLTPSH